MRLPSSSERLLASDAAAASEHSNRDQQAGMAPTCPGQEEVRRGGSFHQDLPVWQESQQAGGTQDKPTWHKNGQAGGEAASDPVQEELRRVRQILGKRGSSQSYDSVGGVSNEEAGTTEQERADAELARRLQEEELGVRPKAQKQVPRKGTLQTFFTRNRAS